jgi:uncharacterized membrane protein YoaK (UPF0700 family)
MVTNMMTGNIQIVANALFDYACRKRLDIARTSQALSALYVVLTFVCGGLFREFSATSRDGQYTPVLPAILLCSVLLAHDRLAALPVLQTLASNDDITRGLAKPPNGEGRSEAYLGLRENAKLSLENGP